VTRGKQTPIETHSASSFRVSIGQDAGVEALDGTTIPYSWHEAGKALTEIQEGTVIVVGGVDVGKTTLCTFLANRLVSEHRSASIVDADIGQTDLGPPTTMAAGNVTQPVPSLSLVEPSERLFIGSTSPSRVTGKVIRGISKLINRHTEPGRLVIVNTDGWVDGGEAVEYKAQMLKEVQPDITLGIGDTTHISRIVETARKAALLVGAPDTIKERTHVDRRELRALGYRRCLANASIRLFRLADITLRDSISLEPLSPNRLPLSRVQGLKDAVVGLLSADDYLQEVGVLRELIPSTETAKILCRGRFTPAKIEVGAVRLDNEAREVTYA